MFKPIALLLILFSINSCTLFTTQDRQDIIIAGENYVLEQGYTNCLLDTNNTELEIGVMEHGNLTDIIQNRHNLLFPKAKFIKASDKGWILGFKYQNKTYNHSDQQYFYCKAIWVSKKGKHIFMYHENLGFSTSELLK